MRERIIQKTGRIREYLQIIDDLKPDCEKRFSTDFVYRGALLHYLYLIADTCIALAETIIRHKKLRPPQSYYHEAFNILGEAKILDPEFAFSFAKISGFRNFRAHDYEKIEAKIVCQEVLNKLQDVEEYL